MQASSLLLLPQRSMGPLDLRDLSEQALMESFIDGLNDNCKRQFKHRDGTFRDVCKWDRIVCNGRRQVIDITLNATDEPGLSIAGTVSLSSLPRRLEGIHAVDVESHDKSDLHFVAVDTAALPRSLQSFEFAHMVLNVSLDLRRLPPKMSFLRASSCRVSGNCCLTSLPRTLRGLWLDRNRLEGSICLDRLPPLIMQISLANNILSGTLNLKKLPYGLLSLYLGENQFSGDVDASYLPENISELYLHDNALHGTFKITRTPKKLQWLAMRGNDLTLPVVISRQAFPLVVIELLDYGCAVDEHGVPYTEAEMDLNDEMQEQRLRREQSNQR